MTRAIGTIRQEGFSLIELLTALGIFLIICGAAFTLLNASQQRYQTESQELNSFQEARLALDQIVRDVNDSGYPPPTYNGGNHNFYADSPFAWNPGYPTPSNPAGGSCAIGTGAGAQCTIPGGFDVIIETKANPQDGGSKVQWIRYQLSETTLYRGVADKAWGDDPAFDTASNLVPFVQNVVNNASQPIFSYTCDTPTAPQPQPKPCSLAGTDSLPANVRDVAITLIVAAPQQGDTTGKPRLVVLNGRGRRVNPNQ
jgi:prepilin-type N-terminal cleavage/methylation domain-containing protein